MISSSPTVQFHVRRFGAPRLSTLLSLTSTEPHPFLDMIRLAAIDSATENNFLK
jgi:hypothetical protein